MREQRRTDDSTRHRPLLCGLLVVSVALLTGCAGPGGEAFATAGAASTARGAAPTAVVATLGPVPTAPASAVRPTMSSSAVAASVTVRTPRPGTTSGSVVANAATATRAGSVVAAAPQPGTATARMAVATHIPAPPNSTPYIPGQNSVLDAIAAAVSEATRGNMTATAISDSRTHQSADTPAVVLAFYRAEMARAGWVEEPASGVRPGVTPLLFSRDNRTVGGLVFVIDAAQVGGRGTLVVTTLAKPA